MNKKRCHIDGGLCQHFFCRQVLKEGTLCFSCKCDFCSFLAVGCAVDSAGRGVGPGVLSGEVPGRPCEDFHPSR